MPAALLATALILASPPAFAEELPFASGVVPHHFVAEPLISDFYRTIANLGAVDTIVLVGPDHFKAASVTGATLTTLDAEDGDRFDITLNGSLLGAIRRRLPVAASTLRLAADHSITVHLPFIRKHFPAAKVLPLLIGRGATREVMDELARQIVGQGNERVAIIASVDFSHYLPKAAAAFHDVRSTRVLLDFESDAFPSLEVDSWQSLYLARRYARLRGMEAPVVVGSANSADFVESPRGESTTSYFSVAFVKDGHGPATAKAAMSGAQSVLLLGDLMLDRKVKALMDDRGERWPFQQARQFLRGADVVLANLEGPVVRRKRTGNAPQRFGFAPSTAELLAASKVNLVSLANNHALDQGEPGLRETRRHLRRAGVAFVGGPHACGDQLAYEHKGIVFLGFNLVGQNVCPDHDLIQAVAKTRARDPGRFIIVTMHWGSEYVKTHAFWQEELAHGLVDAGADLVVGHHPHVVQDIELYRGRLICYSLGNFVFDQYFMSDTQVGLAVGLTVSANLVEWRLFPFRGDESQPSLMGTPDAEVFLSDLARSSSPELASGIHQGKIVRDRFRHP